MINSIVGLNITPQKQNPAHLHTLEDLIGEVNLHKETQFEDWKLLKTIQHIPGHHKISKFINRITNNIYALKTFDNFLDYQGELQQMQRIVQQIGVQKANPYVCICADSDDSERCLFYEIGDCSLKELNEIMVKEECFWFEPNLFSQLNFIIVTCYRILKYFLDNHVYPQNITEDTIQLFRVGPRGDLRPKFMDIFQVDPENKGQEKTQNKQVTTSTPQNLGSESEKLNTQRTSYKQLGYAILEAMYSSVLGIEKQRRKVFYLDENEPHSYKHPLLSDNGKLEKINRYFGGEERDPRCTPQDIQLQQDVVQFVRCLIQRGNPYELDKIFQKIEPQTSPLLDIHGFQRKVIMQQIYKQYKKIKTIPQEQIKDDLETYLDLELVDCGLNLIKQLEDAKINIIENNDLIYYKLKYYLLMGQYNAFNHFIKKIDKKRGKPETKPNQQKSEQDYIHDIFWALSDSVEDDQKELAFESTLEYFTNNYGRFNYQTLRIIIYKVQYLIIAKKTQEIVKLLEPIVQDIFTLDDNNTNFQIAKLECFMLYTRACLDLGKTNKRDLMQKYLSIADDVINRFMIKKTIINGDYKFIQALYTKEIEKNIPTAKKLFYESMQIYKNTVGKKSFKYQDVLQSLCTCILLEKQYEDALPFIEENVAILQQIQLHNSVCETRFNAAKEKLYETYLQTGKGHDHLLDVWLTQGQHFAEVQQFDEALQYMQIGRWLIDRDYIMKIKKKSPGIIYVPSYEMEIREKLIEVRKGYYQVSTIDEKIELYEQGLEMCCQFYDDVSHDKQPTSMLYFSDQYFFFQIELCKLNLRQLQKEKNPDVIKELWEKANKRLVDPYQCYVFDKFKMDTINVYKGICQKQEMSGNKNGEKVHVDKNKAQAMILQRYEKVILKIPRMVFFHQLQDPIHQKDYIPNTNMKMLSNLSSDILKEGAGQKLVNLSQNSNQLSNSGKKEQEDTGCQIF